MPFQNGRDRADVPLLHDIEQLTTVESMPKPTVCSQHSVCGQDFTLEAAATDQQQ